MTFSYWPPDRPPVWMRYTPAEGAVATEAAVDTKRAATIEVAEFGADEELSTLTEDVSEKTAGDHISSVDQVSRLAKREYHRDSIRVGKGRALLSSLVRRLNRAQEAAQQDDVQRVARKMCHPTIGLRSDSIDKSATTIGRCNGETAVDARLLADPIGSPVDCLPVPEGTNCLPKVRRVVAGRPFRNHGRNQRPRHPKIDWLYCPSKAAGSDDHSPRQMMRIATRRPDRAMSSQLSSRPKFDSDAGATFPDGKPLVQRATGLFA